MLIFIVKNFLKRYKGEKLPTIEKQFEPSYYGRGQFSKSRSSKLLQSTSKKKRNFLAGNQPTKQFKQEINALKRRLKINTASSSAAQSRIQARSRGYLSSNKQYLLRRRKINMISQKNLSNTILSMKRRMKTLHTRPAELAQNG